jgi:predicted Zn-dependent protease
MKSVSPCCIPELKRSCRHAILFASHPKSPRRFVLTRPLERQINQPTEGASSRETSLNQAWGRRVTGLPEAFSE